MGESEQPRSLTIEERRRWERWGDSPEPHDLQQVITEPGNSEVSPGAIAPLPSESRHCSSTVKVRALKSCSIRRAESLHFGFRPGQTFEVSSAEAVALLRAGAVELA